MSSEDKYAKNLRWQREANVETWTVLVESGLTSEMKVPVDFCYYSPSEEKAESLKLLLEEHDYEVRISSFNLNDWLVEGRIIETTLTLEKLDEWVLWMIVAGKQYDSDFSGWGIEISDQSQSLSEQMCLF